MLHEDCRYLNNVIGHITRNIRFVSAQQCSGKMWIVFLLCTETRCITENSENDQLKERYVFSKTVQDLLKQLCVKEIRTFLYVVCLNTNGFSTFIVDGNFLNNGNLIWKTGVWFFSILHPEKRESFLLDPGRVNINATFWNARDGRVKSLKISSTKQTNHK